LKIYLQNHNQVLSDIENEFEIVQDINKADAVVLWEDVVGWPLSVARLARELKKPLIVMQHGINAVVDYGPPRKYELLADKLLVWSPSDVRLLQSFGISKDRYQMTGTTIFSHLKEREKHEGVNIVFKPAHWDTDLAENYEVADKLREIVKKNPGWYITTKVMETNDSDKFDNKVFSNREELGHLDKCAEVLSKADIEIAIGGDGTFELMAYAMDIPVVTVLNWKDKSFLGGETVAMKYTSANTLTQLDNLEETIWRVLKNPNENKEERRLVALDYGGIGVTNPKEDIINAIKTCSHKSI
jgi:hypothetical protein